CDRPRAAPRGGEAHERRARGPEAQADPSRHASHGVRAGLPLALCLLTALPAAAEEQRRLDLRELLAIASQSYPEVSVAEAEADAARGTESLARATRRTPRLTLTSA